MLKSENLLSKLNFSVFLWLPYLRKHIKISRLVPLVLCIILLPAAILAETPHSVQIFVHHGVLEDVPENTFAALKRAVELGVDGIEIDIRQTKDNQLVLMHDETIDRTTDGKGRVDQLSYGEIQQYDAGSWRGKEFQKEPIPLLSDVLEFCKLNNLKLILNVRQTCLEKQVMDMVKLHDMSSQVHLWGTLRNADIEDPELYGKELVLLSPEELKEDKVSQIHEEKKYALSTALENDDRKTIKERVRVGVDILLVDYPCVVTDIFNIKSRHIVNTPRKKPGNNPPEDTSDGGGYIQKKVETLIKTIEGDDHDKARAAALAMMVLPQRYTVSPLLKLLKDSNSQVRQTAVWALGLCGDSIIAEHIHPMLKDKHPEVRREAALALKRMGSQQSVPVLINSLKTETDPWVKYDITRTLGTLGDESTVFTLANVILKEKNWHVKSGCVEALGLIRSEKAIEPLTNVLTANAGEDAIWARTMAAWALASIGKKSIPDLIGALRDNEEATRRRASWALVKIGDPAVSALINSLRDPNGFARERAARTLGWIRDERAVASLIWALKDKEPAVVCSAAWALGRIDSPHALSSLQSLINNRNNDIRENVADAIERIKAMREKK